MGNVILQTLLSSSLCQMIKRDGGNQQLLVFLIGLGGEDYLLEKTPRSSCGLWALPTRNFYLCTIVQLFQMWNCKHPDILLAELGRPGVHMPHVAKTSGREFQPHCELSPHLLSAVQPWFTPIPAFSAPSVPWKALHTVPCGHWNVFTSWSVSPSQTHMQRKGKGVCLCGQG